MKKNTQKKSPGVRVTMGRKVHPISDELKHEVHEMFVGKHTVFSLIGLAIGITFIEKSLWHWVSVDFGIPFAFVLGMVIFVVSGLYLHTFEDHPTKKDKGREKRNK